MDPSILTLTEGLNRLPGKLHRHADRKSRLSVSSFTHSLTGLKLNKISPRTNFVQDGNTETSCTLWIWDS